MAKPRKLHQRILDWVFAHVFAPLLAGLLHLLCMTLRWEIRGREHVAPYWNEGKPVIVGCWHGRLLFIPYAWWKIGRGDTYVLMGRNRNGELITRIVAKFNMKAVRGGSRVGGKEARDAMAEVIQKNPASTLSFTPDGPHGPRYESKMGMAHLSRTLGLPVVWVAASASSAVRFKTWDRFMLPRPFAKVIVEFFPPIDPNKHEKISLDDYRKLIDVHGREYLQKIDSEIDQLTSEDRDLLAAGGK
jgi:lysophospholipid acyltransferase (LPLAT)-like uncharacterized protein